MAPRDHLLVSKTIYRNLFIRTRGELKRISWYRAGQSLKPGRQIGRLAHDGALLGNAFPLMLLAAGSAVIDR